MTAPHPAVLDYPLAAPPAPGVALPVAPGILWLRMPLPMALDHINLYLLEDTDGWWIVDTGLRGEETRANWERVFAGHLGGKPVIGMFCTHCHPDHIGQAGWLSERWKAPLWIGLPMSIVVSLTYISLGGPAFAFLAMALVASAYLLRGLTQAWERLGLRAVELEQEYQKEQKHYSAVNKP